MTWEVKVSQICSQAMLLQLNYEKVNPKAQASRSQNIQGLKIPM